MAPKVKVTRYGWTQAEARIWRRIAALGPNGMRRALAHIGAGLVAQYRRNILEGRSAAGKFVHLSPRYAAWKRRHYGQQPILVASKQMYDSLNFSVVQAASSRWRVVAGATGTREDGTPNARVAEGHIRGIKGRLPARNFGAVPKGLVARLQSEAMRKILGR